MNINIIITEEGNDEESEAMWLFISILLLRKIIVEIWNNCVFVLINWFLQRQKCLRRKIVMVRWHASTSNYRLDSVWLN